MGLVAKILEAEPRLSIPVPIEELARRLDIEDIRTIATDSFEGGLVTDEARSSGFILVNRRATPKRRRFTIGHELGHFLLRNHRPLSGEFQCSRADLKRWTHKGMSASVRMEVEANQFASAILMPPPIWQKALAKFSAPALPQIIEHASTFNVSTEAAARAYVQYHDQSLAVVIIKDGTILRIYCDIRRFPSLCVEAGSAVPATSLFFRAPKKLHRASSINRGDAGFWLESDWGKQLPRLYEQVFFQRDGYALLMLWAEKIEDDEYDPEENKTSAQRLRDRQTRRES